MTAADYISNIIVVLTGVLCAAAVLVASWGLYKLMIVVFNHIAYRKEVKCQPIEINDKYFSQGVGSERVVEERLRRNDR